MYNGFVFLTFQCGPLWKTAILADEGVPPHERKIKLNWIELSIKQMSF